MSEIAFDQAGALRKGEAPDLEALSHYLAAQHPKLQGKPEIRQFPGGYSNLTYLLRYPQGDFVLRRPPHGAKIKSAHDMGREFKVLSRLRPVYAKVPEPLVYCAEDDILGAPFYVMERLNGVIIRNKAPEGLELSPEFMGRLSLAAIDNLVELHEVDVEASGLIDLGKPEGYVQRQVEGWIRRYQKSETDEIPAMNLAAEWMLTRIPEDGKPAFIHNDYKYDNLVLRPDQPDALISGVLDWEMATVGDPLMDLGTSLAYWAEDSDSPALKPFGLTWLPGNLSRQQVIERYAAQTGRQIDEMLFYYIFGCFKVGVIAQQIYKRFKQGFTKDPRFGGLIHVVRAAGGNAQKAAKFGRIHDFH